MLLPAALLVFFSCSHNPGEQGEVDTTENAIQMQKFVENISSHARSRAPGFIIVPQNGSELAFTETGPDDTEPDYGVRHSYISAIDGIGIEELFYNGNLNIDNERLDMLEILKDSVKIMVSDYVSDNNKISDAVKRDMEKGFIAFPRRGDNYDYTYIPNASDLSAALTSTFTSDNITELSEAKNFLYLIGPDLKKYPTKASLIDAINKTNYDVVLIDLFTYNPSFTREEIDQLKNKANSGKRLVLSYISIGSAEKYRYYWQKGWKKGKPSWLKKAYEGYPDEFWVQYWNKEWQDIIYNYIDKIIDAGFDGAYLDNVEAYYFLVNN